MGGRVSASAHTMFRDAPSLQALRPSHFAVTRGQASRHAGLRLAFVAIAHLVVIALIAQQMSDSAPLSIMRAKVLELRTVSTPIAVTIDLPAPLKMATRPPPVKTQQHSVVNPQAVQTIEPVANAPATNLVATSSGIESSATTTDNVAKIAAASPPPAGVAQSVATPPKIELPSSSADYLNNPAPTYPPVSKRQGERGTVLLHVWVETDGSAARVEIKKTSGFDRLDEAAVSAVRKWKFVPGQRDGTVTAMWVNVPVVFELRS
jgi:periplasmic protein TonB